MQTAPTASRSLDRDDTATERAIRTASPPARPARAALLGVTARMRLTLFLLLALPPGAALYLVENGHVASPGRMLGLWLALALVLLLPLSRLAARFVALGDIAALNAFCGALRRGDYHRRLPLPPQGDDEHEILRLKRDLNWLAHSVETRETWLRALLDETKERERHFEGLSRTDGLTGLANRRHFDAMLPPLADDAVARNFPFWLLLIDCDAFKAINDRFGHPTGDTVLAAMGKTLRDSTREGLDMAFRLGGDEFAVVLTRLPRSGAMRVAERIRERFAAANAYGATASLGVACLDPRRDPPPRLESLAARCDAALYRAKTAGGDQTALAGPDAPAE
uniref:diguanylate cyclase n=1 Tax=Desulfovibrio sp. U5L TaxID=596152 RepID=I2Q2H0_9BACT